MRPIETPATVAELPFFASGRHPKPDLIGRCREGAIETVSGRDLVEKVRDLSLGLGAIGMARGDRVALLAESRPEWLLADFAILAAGAVTTPIYPTLSAEQVAFILRDSEAAFAIVMFVLFLPLSFLIPSSSGLATVAMPITAPLAGFVDVPESIVVTAYQSASGLMNLFIPTSAVVMGGLAIARVPYGTYLRWVWPLLAALAALCVVVLGVSAAVS